MVLNLYKVPSSWLIYKYTILYMYNFLKSYIQRAYFQSYKLVFLIPKGYLRDICKFFKQHSNLKFSGLVELTVRDNPGYVNRFLITYVLSSKWIATSLLLSSYIGEYVPTISLTTLFKAAHWFENEIWEFYGVYFYNPKNLFKQRRLLTDYGFQGYPLRKDFPLSGFYEIIYIPSVNRFENVNQGKALYLETLIGYNSKGSLLTAL